MKHIKILIILSLVLPTISLAIKGDEVYSIIKVNGNITNTKNNKKLSMGDTISMKDKVAFENLGGSCFLFSKGAGRFILKPGEALTVNVETAIKPVGTRASITTRGASIIADTMAISDMFYFFGKNKFVFFKNETNIKLDPAIFTNSKDRVLIAKYTNSKGETVNKEIGKASRNYTLDLSTIFLKDAAGKLDVKEFEIFDYNKATKDIKKCASITPIMVDEKELYNEIKAIVLVFGNADGKEKTMTEIQSFLYDQYGEFNPADLKAFIEAHHLL